MPDQLIDDFKRAALDLDCKRMVLKQHKENGESFEGSGYIRQSPDGSLIFKIYVSQTNADRFGRLQAIMNGNAGTLFSDEMFYDLDATAYNGTHWKAHRILPKPHWYMTDMSVFITGELQSVSATFDLPQAQNYLRLHFFEEYSLPLHKMSDVEVHGRKYAVLDTAEFDACGSQFEVRRREGSADTTIEVTSENTFPIDFDLRIQEALQFITAKTAFWRARLNGDRQGLRLDLASPSRKSSRTQFSPPIAPIFSGYREFGWALFGKYLAYVLQSTKGTYWNPVAYHLYNACEATANSVDAWAVGISVAVEAVTGLISIPGDGQAADRVKAFQARMRDCLAAQMDFADMAPRMEGLIGAMGQKRPQDTLYALARTGHAEKAYVEAWEYLRHRHVHPKLKDLEKPTAVDNQKLIDHIHRVEVLLRQLTFYLIGYEGPFTDYGDQGGLVHPVKQYPLGDVTEH